MGRPLHLSICMLGGLALAVSGCGSSKSGTTITTPVTSASTGTTAQTTPTSANGGSTSANGGSTAPNGSTTGPNGGATAPSGGSTGPSGGSTTKLTPTEAAEASLLRRKQAAEQRIAQIRARYRAEGTAEKRAQLEATERAARKKHKPYSHYVQVKFTSACQEAKGSASQCTCILSKQEFSNVESELSFAELVALELAFQRGATIQQVAHPLPPQRPVALPGGVRIHLEQCLAGK